MEGILKHLPKLGCQYLNEAPALTPDDCMEVRNYALRQLQQTFLMMLEPQSNEAPGLESIPDSDGESSDEDESSPFGTAASLQLSGFAGTNICSDGALDHGHLKPASSADQQRIITAQPWRSFTSHPGFSQHIKGCSRGNAASTALVYQSCAAVTELLAKMQPTRTVTWPYAPTVDVYLGAMMYSYKHLTEQVGRICGYGMDALSPLTSSVSHTSFVKQAARFECLICYKACDRAVTALVWACVVSP